MIQIITFSLAGPGTVFCDNTSYIFMFLSIATSNLVATSLARQVIFFFGNCCCTTSSWLILYHIYEHHLGSGTGQRSSAASDIYLDIPWVGLWCSNVFLYEIIWYSCTNL